MEKNELRVHLEHSQEARRKQRTAVKGIILMTGANIMTPDEIAEPYVKEAEQAKNFTDLLIDLGNAKSQKEKKAMVIAGIAKNFKHNEILDIMDTLACMTDEILLYVTDHPEAREKPDVEEFMNILKSGMDNLD